MTLGSIQLDLSVQVAAVVVPVAAYFLVLGLLNSRPHPQLLRGRRDFAVLVAALCPLFVLPMLAWMSSSPAGIAAGAGAGAVVILVLAPPRRSWVLYNITVTQAREAVDGALRAAGIVCRKQGRTFFLGEDEAKLTLAAFPLLRNVSLRLEGQAAAELAGRFEAALERRLAGVAVKTAPMAMALLLVATAMLAAPLAMVAPRVPEIVRLISGILH
jgi:hypothetical protein